MTDANAGGGVFTNQPSGNTVVEGIPACSEISSATSAPFLPCQGGMPGGWNDPNVGVGPGGPATRNGAPLVRRINPTAALCEFMGSEVSPECPPVLKRESMPSLFHLTPTTILIVAAQNLTTPMNMLRTPRWDLLVSVVTVCRSAAVDSRQGLSLEVTLSRSARAQDQVEAEGPSCARNGRSSCRLLL